MNWQKVPLAAGLWLVGVPIGTARDITLRALDVLASADTLVAEDTRSLRKLMEIHAVPLQGRRIQSLHDHSDQSVIERLVALMRDGQSVAYASEAGMPLIADPGFGLVRAVRDAGLPVTSAPGPSAVTTALALAGLPTDRFHFAGFLPASRAARQKALASVAGIGATLVFYESPKRLAAMLRDAGEMLGPDRQARVCRELTKRFEEVRAGTLAELAEAFPTPPKGEIVVLIDRGETPATTPRQAEDMLRTALQTLSVKEAAAQVAHSTGQKKRDLYQLALRLKGEV